MARGRSPFGVVFMIGFGILVGAVLFGGAEAIGTVLAAPFVVLGFVFKIVLFFVLLSVAARLFARAGSGSRRSGCWSGTSHQEWSERTRPRWYGRGEFAGRDEAESKADRFDEWHRMAHARQEVDDHTPPIED